MSDRGLKTEVSGLQGYRSGGGSEKNKVVKNGIDGGRNPHLCVGFPHE